MLVALITLWFVMALILLCYGASNSAVVELGWPRWSTPAIMAAGCAMVAVMFLGMGLSIVTNVPGDWHLRNLHSHSPDSGGD
jgi:uncharacterized integral membrane protein